MIERERKYRLGAGDAVRLAGLLEQSGASGRTEEQETVDYADPTGRLRGLNLRARAVAGRWELTVKGPRLEDGLSKVRAEHTIQVSGDPQPVLEALGLAPALRYLKHTTIFSFEGATVSLDEVEGLGAYCEIEASDDATIERIAGRLGVSNDALEPRGYARLVKSRTAVPREEVR